MDDLRVKFRYVPAENTPAYFWFINDHMDVESLKKQLRDMFERGARSVCLHPVPAEFRPRIMPSRMSPPYLSEEYFKIITELIDECEKTGMNYYFYDEGGWPSGGACGQVMKNHPEWSRRFLEKNPTGKIVEKIIPANPAEAAPFPDLLRREPTEEFIRLTHEAHARHVGRHFGKTIRFTFTDEPCFTPSNHGRIGWSANFAAEFQQRKGYDITAWLDKLVTPPQQVENEELVKARIDYHEVCTRLFVDNYLLPIRDWCRQNNLLSGGHFNGEDEPLRSRLSGYGSIMKTLRALDLPGVDVIWRQLYPGLREHSFPKYASSVANQAGSNYAMGELFGVYGNGLTPELLRWLVDYMFAHGVNLHVFGSYPQANYGNWMAGCRPHFGPDDPLWKYFDILNDYTGRISYLMSRGKAVRHTAVVFDIRSLWAGNWETPEADLWREQVSKRLLQRRCAFDYIDEDVLAEAEIIGKEIHVGDICYSELIVPDRRRLTPEAEAVISAFQKAGGRICSDPEDATSLFEVFPETAALRIEARQLDDGRKIFFLFNSIANEMELELCLPDVKNLVFCDAENGCFEQVRHHRGRFAWKFGRYSSALFLSDSAADSEIRPEFVPGFRETLLGTWHLRALRRHLVGLEHLEICNCENFPELAVSLGDWRRYIGEDFSGDAVYRLDFDWSGDTVESTYLDLGQVNYACSVNLNGIELGRRLWGPYRFPVASALKTGSNCLSITVTNTLANAFAAREVDLRLEHDYPPRSVYEFRQRDYERESLPSGLFGPVTLVR